MVPFFEPLQFEYSLCSLLGHVSLLPRKGKKAYRTEQQRRQGVATDLLQRNARRCCLGSSTLRKYVKVQQSFEEVCDKLNPPRAIPELLTSRPSAIWQLS